MIKVIEGLKVKGFVDIEPILQKIRGNAMQYPGFISDEYLVGSKDITMVVLLSIWYDIEIIYTDGSWIYVTAFQTDQGHIISNSGTGTPNKNLIDGTVLEPLSALDCLVTTIYNLLSNHID